MNKGYIALISAIILSAILLAVAASISTIAYHHAAGELGSTSKEQSYALAYSCLDHALLQRTLNSSYTGNETFTVASSQCSIGTIGMGPGGDAGTLLIPTSATFGESTTSIAATVNATTLQMISFREK